MSSRKDRIGIVQGTKLPNEFYVLAADPIFWQSKAAELHRAALVLADQFFKDTQNLKSDIDAFEKGHINELPSQEPNVINQFVLLAAFALENLFKGLVLFKEPNLIKEGKTTAILRSHDLLALAGRADVPLVPEEHRFCVLASSASINWGRYPISNTAETAVGTVKVSGHSVEAFEKLFQKANSLFAERFTTRVKGPLC